MILALGLNVICASVRVTGHTTLAVKYTIRDGAIIKESGPLPSLLMVHCHVKMARPMKGYAVPTAMSMNEEEKELLSKPDIKPKEVNINDDTKDPDVEPHMMRTFLQPSVIYPHSHNECLHIFLLTLFFISENWL